ncbi:recQ-mediated genome instability protein 1-like [Plodia interpunctella]|uniref:recQ-mediated genome instability protein 1-like n=1 Tax=Plodia interpunctella TaxID=58824 RepID=UPI0023678AC1|nr:recQ-mediated genome instability protein 1-like [Plodia interpunctella]
MAGVNMSSESLINSVRQFLSSHSMLVEDEWLTGCVEYLTEDNSNNYSVTDIQNLAKEQWLLNDLKDICPGSLPANLKNVQKTVLNGKFALQINAAVDIGTPAYQQYLKLQKVNMENIEATTKFEDKVPSHRMIKLYLTDGAQEVSAIEYKPMRNLSCDITPGCKMYLKGPVECRRGVILLTESSIELLGGEVQEIAVSNSLAGLLSTKLGLPMTLEPIHNTTIRNANIPTPHSDVPPPIDHYTEPVPEPTRPVARVTSVQIANNFVDDDIDMDQLAAIEAQYTENPTKRPLSVANTNPEKKIKIDSTANKSDDYPDDADVFFDEDEEYLRDIEEKIDARDREINRPKGPVTVSAEPFVYIKQINDMNLGEKTGKVFKVKAQIIKLLSKLSVGKDGWSLKCSIVDGTGSIDVEFTSDVLSKVVGLTPQEMHDIKKKMAMNPAMKEKAVSALQKAKDTLQVLHCIIELTILEVPKITSLEPYGERHAEMLKKRMQSAGL